ncbi:B12-binding domain-containing radical SAM protein [Bacillus fonticola]|uniref:B12-binding domain-containing radical SAM protein n=1 Tax=Bacillus fonticola TaxID=2728853 RepID=UPI001475018B|nr:B12-binding domain-containing radical SAM protein [Bacillus fonticola]
MKVVLSSLNAKYIHTNLAIRYLKAYAAPTYEVELAEYTMKDPVMSIVADIMLKKPDVVGFSCYIWNIEETILVGEMIKKVSPSTKIIFGGPEVTYDVEEWMTRLHTYVDFIVFGEGEKTFLHLLEALDGHRSIAEVKGIVRWQNDQPRIHFPQEKIDLKDIPSPFRFEGDFSQYPSRITYIETSRGCPFQCQFCLSSIEVGVRYFDREAIKEEIRFLMSHGAKTIKFVDRTFNISRRYAMDMFQFLIDEHVPGTVFQFEITGDIMRPEVIEFLNERAPVGLFRFEIGVQSTNDATNELVKRKQNFEKLTRTVQMVKSGGKIVQHLDLIAGLPDEDAASFRNTFNDVFALRPEELQLGFLKLLRGTGLRIQAEQYEYEYMSRAPYEMLQNRVLSFEDVIRIKQVEDVLEKYWNDHRMDRTVEYLVDHVFSSPYDFFQEFGSYWDVRGWSRIGHQLEDLFRRLYAFLSAKGIEDLAFVEGLMKMDYLFLQKHRPRKPWWEKERSKDEQKALTSSVIGNPQLLNAVGLTEKELFKHTIIEVLPDDYDTYAKTGARVRQPQLLIVNYKDRLPRFHFSPLKAHF